MNLLNLALGRFGLTLHPPESVEVLVLRPLSAEAATPNARGLVEAALEQPLSGPPLKELIPGKRRAALLVGDVTWPAPYEAVLPTLVDALVSGGIRPTRIVTVAFPGEAGTVIGRSAVRRYGEQILGDHDIFTFLRTEDLVDFDACVAVFPQVPGVREALSSVRVDFALALQSSTGLVPQLAGVRCGSVESLWVPQRALPEVTMGTEVELQTGGGAPADATLEDALASWRRTPTRATTRVLAFDGAEGLGSSYFTQELFKSLRRIVRGEKAEPHLPAWTPARALEESLQDGGRIVLYSPGLAEHGETEYLKDVLLESPSLAERFKLVETEVVLWLQLEQWYGKTYRLFAEPLGWRGESMLDEKGLPLA